MNFTQATDDFLAAADWLTAADAPAVVSLQVAAAELDEAMNPALLSQYRLTYNGLLKRQPTATTDADPLEALLKR